jgi:hypothetical protein
MTAEARWLADNISLCRVIWRVRRPGHHEAVDHELLKFQPVH